MLRSLDTSDGRPVGDLSTQGRAIDIMLVIASVVIGMFLPVVSAFAVPGGLINLPWGSVYGLGFAGLEWTIGLHRGGMVGLTYGLAGFVLWPIVVAYTLGRLLRTLRHGGSTNVRWGCRALIVLTLLVAMPIPNVQGTFAEGLPLFTKYIDF